MDVLLHGPFINKVHFIILHKYRSVFVFQKFNSSPRDATNNYMLSSVHSFDVYLSITLK